MDLFIKFVGEVKFAGRNTYSRAIIIFRQYIKRLWTFYFDSCYISVRLRPSSCLLGMYQKCMIYSMRIIRIWKGIQLSIQFPTGQLQALQCRLKMGYVLRQICLACHKWFVNVWRHDTQHIYKPCADPNLKWKQLISHKCFSHYL